MMNAAQSVRLRYPKRKGIHTTHDIHFFKIKIFCVLRPSVRSVQVRVFIYSFSLSSLLCTLAYTHLYVSFLTFSHFFFRCFRCCCFLRLLLQFWFFSCFWFQIFNLMVVCYFSLLFLFFYFLLLVFRSSVLQLTLCSGFFPFHFHFDLEIFFEFIFRSAKKVFKLLNNI